MLKITGLTNKEVIESREKYGSNIMTIKEKDSFLKMFIESLGDPIIRILLIALGLKTLFLLSHFDWYETVGIAIAIFIASFVSTLSEYGSEEAFKKLQAEASKMKSKVYRESKLIEVETSEIVCNDIILLRSGDKVPADALIISGSIWVDESAINGESKEKVKDTINNKIFLGSVVSHGEALAKVEAVGDKTIYGSIGLELQEDRRDSPLKIRLRELSLVISKFGYMGAFLVSFAYLFHTLIVQNQFQIHLISQTLGNGAFMAHHLLHAITLAVTIIVVSVPEGLPMMITVVLSSNMKRLLKDHVLVRKLVGIETSGNVNILFTDKTGTITTGKMKVSNFLLGNGKELNAQKIDHYPILFEKIRLSLIYNNDSILNNKGEVILGNATDRTLLEYIKANIKEEEVVIEKVLPFDSENKLSITRLCGRHHLYLIKGAPEKIINACTYYLDEKGIKKEINGMTYLNKKQNEIASTSVRFIALAISEDYVVNPKHLKNLTFIGLIGIRDQIRKEVPEVMRRLEEASVKVVMLTGDSKETALAFAREALSLHEDDIVLTSSELKEMDDLELKKILPKLKVVARALPSDKTRFIRVSQELNLIVGMTGDGVNDAPALKKADASFAMGSGTEVAKEASDIVILDDNFVSIYKSILYGRTIFKSIRKFIIFQLTINVCAVGLSIVGPFIGIKDPITVIQMLWINMVMDTFAALAFAGEPPIKEYMLEKPKKHNEPIINKYMYNQILVTGIYSVILLLVFLQLPVMKQLFHGHFMTAFFALFIFMGIFNSFNARTHRLNLFSNIFKNRGFVIVMSFVFMTQLYLIYYGGHLFRVTGLLPEQLFFVLFLALTVIPFDFVRKILFRLKGEKGGV